MEISRVQRIACVSVVTVMLAIGGCFRQQGIEIQASGRWIAVDGDASVATFEITSPDAVQAEPRALLFYIQGSERESVDRLIPKFAGAVLLGARPIFAERRGVGFEGEVDAEAAIDGSGFATRIADHHAVMKSYMKEHPDDLPVILVGGSEGGAVAGAIAAREPRVTHLVLVSTGGWTQAREIGFLVDRDGTAVGLESIDEMRERFQDIKSNPESRTLWAGQPYLRWSSFLWYDPLTDLRSLRIPVFVAHGVEDRSVPVQSARAIRDALDADSNPNITYIEFDGLDHSLFHAELQYSGFPLLEVELVRFFAEHGLLSERQRDVLTDRVRRNHPDVFGWHRSNRDRG